MKSVLRLSVLVALSFLVSNRSSAQIPGLGTIVTAVINAIDVGVQKLQTETIFLQDAQREVENTMSSLELSDISSWLQKEKDLYGEYYQELWKIKSYISYYDRVKDIINKQALILKEYESASANFKKDSHFSPNELAEMAKVYSGLLSQSVDNLSQIQLVINSFVTQMTDAQRLKIIDDAGSKIDKNYSDILQFDQQNIAVSMQRSRDENDLQMVKALYGIQ